MNEKKIRMEMENALTIGYRVQASLLQTMRMMSAESGDLVRNELENAVKCTEISLACLEDIVGRHGSVTEVISHCDGYLAAVRKAKDLSMPYLDDIEIGNIGQSLDCAEEALVSIKSTVDGYKSM